MSKTLSITVFTDPTCPFAYSTEPTRWRLRWLYGEQLKWTTKMITLSGYDGETSHMTPERTSTFRAIMREQYDMPMDDTQPPRVPESILACKAYIAASLNAPEAAAGLLRLLQIAAMSGELIDEQSAIDVAAEKAGVDTKSLSTWMQDKNVSQKLAQDADAARDPSATALNMRHKLSKTSTERVRYPASSYIFSIEDNVVFELPGFWPLEAYEATIGNFLPNATRADNPQSAQEVLTWAKTPLATKEVAVLLEKNIDSVREELKEVASLQPVGQDGFWTLK